MKLLFAAGAVLGGGTSLNWKAARVPRESLIGDSVIWQFRSCLSCHSQCWLFFFFFVVKPMLFTLGVPGPQDIHKGRNRVLKWLSTFQNYSLSPGEWILTLEKTAQANSQMNKQDNSQVKQTFLKSGFAFDQNKEHVTYHRGRKFGASFHMCVRSFAAILPSAFSP